MDRDGEMRRSFPMKVKIISWNVSEMNDPNKMAIIKVGVREWGRTCFCDKCLGWKMGEV